MISRKMMAKILYRSFECEKNGFKKDLLALPLLGIVFNSLAHITTHFVILLHVLPSSFGWLTGFSVTLMIVQSEYSVLSMVLVFIKLSSKLL